MTKAHSPAPWSYECHAIEGGTHNGVNTFTIHHHDGKNLVSIASGYGELSNLFPSNEQAESNARLIASAPELLEALEHLLNGSISLPRFAEEQARAAIAKAKGE